MDKATDKAIFPVKLSREMLQQLKFLALQNNLSLQKLIFWILTEWVAGNFTHKPTTSNQKAE